MDTNQDNSAPEIFSFDVTDRRRSVTLRWPDGRVLAYKIDTSRYTDTPEVIAAKDYAP